jgi:2-polyprenyl-3-methyl-5-hydroxy-6-metoxy-1,4-benzoquinol methylase
VWDDLGAQWALDHYPDADERERLLNGAGRLEFARTTEILLRHLPKPPARVADIGSGAGPYSLWLAEQGHSVVARDLVPLHIEQLRAAATDRGLVVDAAVGEARALDLPDASADIVLLLGPLYHLISREARTECWREARRIVTPGGVVMAAAISRCAVLFDGILRLRLGEGDPAFVPIVDAAMTTGVLPPLTPGGFAAYAHRPDELPAEAREAGLDVISLESVEGAGGYLPDLEERWADPAARAAVIDVARRCAAVPELLGIGSHLLLVASRP